MVELDKEVNDLYIELSQFRATHTYRRCNVTSVDWEYLVGGQGTETLLLLPGVHGLGELAFQHISRFEQTYRVISPDYPAGATTVTQLIEGLLEILNAENINAVHVVGGSYSGMIAQCLVRRHPDKIKKLILDHTGPPSRKRIVPYKLFYKLLALLPITWIRMSLKLVNRLFPMEPVTQKTFWRAYFDEVIATLTKKDYLSRIQVCLDFDQNYRFTRDDLCCWSGEMLIIESDNDTFVSSQEREALKTLYPQAQIYTFRSTGHSAWATQFETFFSVIAQFLQEGK
ncbi:MAG TPA: alpha/beta hydrolase [Ktedonobacteraceae bacterium]|nr:alpha/beta hydrolase [Ktedonobacteraceae bacterium]